jgi:hypothetical protein
VRRNLAPVELGDLLMRPINAILALHRLDGRILQTKRAWDYADETYT